MNCCLFGVAKKQRMLRLAEPNFQMDVNDHHIDSNKSFVCVSLLGEMYPQIATMLSSMEFSLMKLLERCLTKTILAPSTLPSIY